MAGYIDNTSFKCISAKTDTTICFQTDEVVQCIKFDVQPIDGGFRLETGGSLSDIDGSIYLWRAAGSPGVSGLAYIEEFAGDEEANRMRSRAWQARFVCRPSPPKRRNASPNHRRNPAAGLCPGEALWCWEPLPCPRPTQYSDQGRGTGRRGESPTTRQCVSWAYDRKQRCVPCQHVRLEGNRPAAFGLASPAAGRPGSGGITTQYFETVHYMNHMVRAMILGPARAHRRGASRRRGNLEAQAGLC